MPNHSSILAWEIPWTEEPGWLQSIGSQRVGHDWATNTFSNPFSNPCLIPQDLLSTILILPLPSSSILLSVFIRRQTEWKQQSQKTHQTDHMNQSHVIQWNYEPCLVGHPRWIGSDGECWQNVVHRKREWQTTSLLLPWEPHEQYEEAKRWTEHWKMNSTSR